MAELQAKIRLRPTRIGFLVRPSDKISLRKIMHINASLWGGLYNPIIPVFTRPPKEWKDDLFSKNGKEIAKGYISFFEPDVFVEAEKGLIEKVGVVGLKSDHSEKKVTLLDNFFENEYRGLNEPEFGQSVFDILEDVYEKERKFQLRDEHPAIYSANQNLFSEACIGCYPLHKRTEYLKKQYFDIYRPEETKPSPELWLKIYGDQCETPFSVTCKHLDVFRAWHDEPIIFVFSPANAKDVIDLWNLRIQPSPVYPVPIEWLPDLTEPIRKFISSNHRPLKHNQHGVMHSVTIEVSRSIGEEEAKESILPHFDGLPNGSFAIKFWRTRIWDVDYNNHFVHQPERAAVTAQESDQAIELKDNSLIGTFDSLAPQFAERFGGSNNRWANVVRISAPFRGSHVALSLPYNALDRTWPYTGIDDFAVGREGWVFLQRFKSTNQYIHFLNHEEAFSRWFERVSLKAKSSEAGRIARQMLESLDGFWGLYLVDDKETIQFINKQALSTRKRYNNESGESVEEDFRGRSAAIGEWQQIIQQRKGAGRHHLIELSHYVKHNVVKVGLETECSHCGAKNWHGLDEVSYEVRCLRCLKYYDFPQGNLKSSNQNWRYRVIGPFAVPDYAQGAYASLLTIRFFSSMGGHDVPYSFSTALDLEGEHLNAEIDFAIWMPEERKFDVNGEPRLIIGEAKSFGENAIKDDDLAKLKKSATALPGSIIVISVLKKEFSDAEKERLRDFVAWAREPINYGPRHWVILLTGTELFSHHLEGTWNAMEAPFSEHANFHSTNFLEPLSDATLSIYLGLEPFHEWRREKQTDKPE